MICKYCGKDVLENSKLCLSCGKEVNNVFDQENLINNEFGNEIKRGRKKYLILLVLLIIAEVIMNQLDSKLDLYPLIVIAHLIILVLFIKAFIETVAVANIMPTWVFVVIALIIYIVSVPYLLIGSISLLDIALQIKKYYLSKKRRV